MTNPDFPEERFEQAVAEFLAAEEAGQAISLAALVRKHSVSEAALQEFIAAHLRLRDVAAPLRNQVQAVVHRWAGDSQASTARHAEATLAYDSASSAEDSASGSSKPSSFGEYELIAELGRGGMGVVYKARQRKLRRVVALKMVLAGRFAEANELERFRQEALTAAALEHPQIVPIYEAGEMGGLPYFSMAYVEGISLAELIKQGPLPVIEGVKIMRQVTEAVAYAHGQGVIHRDLKPANILLTRDAEGKYRDPKITDFGLARRMDGEEHLTATGQVLGTPSFMSPEQAAGRPHAAEAAADIFSLGAMLFTVLVGRPPFVADSPMEIVLQVLEKDPPALRSLRPQVPKELEWICLRCLEKKPADRYHSAADLAADLDRFLRKELPVASAGSWWHRLRRWGRRDPVAVAHFGGLALMLVMIQFIYATHEERDSIYHLRLCAVLLGWFVAAGVLQQLSRFKREESWLPFAWSVVDVGFLTAVYALLVPPLGTLLGGYHLLIAAAGLFFRVRLVSLTTLLAIGGSLLLAVLRPDALGPWHYVLYVETTLVLTGLLVGYQIWRLGILRDYYEDRRGR